MKIAISCCDGFIGTYLTERLQGQNLTLIKLTRYNGIDLADTESSLFLIPLITKQAKSGNVVLKDSRPKRGINVSTARFANVAFSDGSLLYGFSQRIRKKQPIVAHNDIKRYSVTPKESGELCLMSCIFGENRDIFFARLSADLHLTAFTDIAVKYPEGLGYEPYLCEDENEARLLINSLLSQGKWPCHVARSDTTDEKKYEVFLLSAKTWICTDLKTWV